MGRGARVKAFLQNDATGEVKHFLYNPSHLADSKGNNYKEIVAPSSGYPIFAWTSGKTHDFMIELYLEGKPEQVKGWVAWLNDFLAPHTAGVVLQPPPTFTFAFGWFVKRCIMLDLQCDYLRFTEDLQPVEAIVQIPVKVVY